MTATGIRPTGPAAPSLLIRARDLLVSEWTKFWSVRSTYWTLLVAVVTPVLLSDLIAFAFSQPSAKRSPGPPPDPLLPGFYSLEYAVLAVCVLGVLQFSSEYGTGLIRTTFVAVPRRRAVLAAKAVIVGLAAFIVGEITSFASFFLDQAVLHTHHLGVSWSHPGVPGAVLADGILLLVCAMLAFALGVIIRHTAGGIAAVVALIALPSVLGLLPGPWGGRIGRFTLIDAMQQVALLDPRADMFSPAVSMLVLFAWPAVALVIAAVVITRTEA